MLDPCTFDEQVALSKAYTNRLRSVCTKRNRSLVSPQKGYSICSLIDTDVQPLRKEFDRNRVQKEALEKGIRQSHCHSQTSRKAKQPHLSSLMRKALFFFASKELPKDKSWAWSSM